MKLGVLDVWSHSLSIKLREEGSSVVTRDCDTGTPRHVMPFNFRNGSSSAYR